jgi:phosphoglucosamine mutase
VAALEQISFGTDGIRGIAGEPPLDVLSVTRIGWAIGRWLAAEMGQAPNVVIGCDTRRSSEWISHTLAGALLAEGCHVQHIGVISTPGVAHNVRASGFDLGIMISASHNPADQNGIKLFGADGFKLDDAEEEAIEALINGSEVSASHGEFGSYSASDDGVTRYLNHLKADLATDVLTGLRVVLDCANGAAYSIAPRVFAELGAEVNAINTTPDGYNINVRAGSEHVRRDRQALVEHVVSYQADLGVAFDGDADRVVFVTPEGMLIDGDHVLGLLAVELQARGALQGATVVATDMSNTGLEDFLTQHQIAMSRTKVGDRYVMERMRDNGFTLGGEQAGHIILLDADHTCGDGVYAGLQIAALVAESKRKGGAALTELASRIPRYPQVIASVHLADRVDLKTLPELIGLQQETLEVFGGKGRVNMRFSGTEPNLLRTMIEGGPTTSLETVVGQVMSLCQPVIRATKTSQPHIDIVDCVTGAPVHL